MSFFKELKRRNVFRVGAAYVVTSWLLLQVADIVIDNIEAPGWVIQVFMLALALGFPLALFFAWAFELTPEGLKKEKDVNRAESITQVTGRKLDFAIIAVLLVALGYFAFDKWSPGSPAVPTEAGAEVADVTPATSDAGGAPATDSRDEKSIAVLPFVNMSDDAANEYFSDGISEEILNALARVKDLKVAGRTSSFAFKGKNQDLREIGTALDVSHILEGSVRKSGNRVRITAQLIKVDDGYHLWSENYDRELTDVFAIQDEISNAILEALRTHLITAGESATLASSRADVAAYELYLAAKEKIYTRSRTSLEQARDMLIQALQIDGNYAPAHAQLGIVTLLLSNQTYGDTPLAETLQKARPMIDKSLQLDPQLAEGYAALALYYVIQPGQGLRGSEAAEKALAINPNLTNARNWLRNNEMSRGNLREVARLDAEISVRDPLYGPGIGNSVFSLLWSGKPQEAQALIDRIGPFLPDHPIIANSQGNINITQGNLAESIKEYKDAYEKAPSDLFVYSLYSSALLQLNDYQTVVEMGSPSEKVIALLMFDRPEEATAIASRLAASGEDATTQVYLFAQQGQFDALVQFVESRWSSIGEYEEQYPERSGWGTYGLAHIAQAYRHVGNESKFRAALSLMKFSLDHQREQGAENIYINFSEALYHQLAGDEEQALHMLARAVDAGWVSNHRIAKQWPAFRELEAHPEYQAIQQRMVEHLNRERLSLDLDPVSA
jgi:TolB-like protein/predicted negative regulator of RcsB-dependent stress response